LSMPIALILALATLFPSLASAYDLLVLASRRDPATEEVLKGFRGVCNTSHRMLVLSDYAEVDVVRIVREEHPRFILAVGDAALKAASRVSRTPIIALMALGVRKQAASQPNLTGIDMFASPEQYMEVFNSLKSRRVGVIHNPAKSGWYLRLARPAAEKAGVVLVTREVASSRDTLTQLSSLSGKVDALWMLPDTTAVSRESSEAYFHFGQSHSIPVVSFSGSYLVLGAGAVVEINRIELGHQACDMSKEILKGATNADMPLEFPRNTSLKTNPEVLKRLNPISPF
jgi:putative tryptophan/tyrosine transport system substrate-binding protein